MSVHETSSSNGVILYDGVCTLCDHAVQFILPRDPKAHFRFASLQGDYAKNLMARHQIPMTTTPESLILVENGQVYQYSSAALRIAGHLRLPWSVLPIFLLVPAPIRDAVYRYIARNRYRWFGKTDACILPRPEWRDRFLDPS